MKALLALVCVVLAGSSALACGSEASDDGAGGDGFQTGLSFALQPDGAKGETERQELSCTQIDSDNEAACGAVEALPEKALEPIGKNQICTDLYGGPDLLNVEGTLDGRDVDIDLSRGGGCEIARFDAWTAVIEQLYTGYEPGSSLEPPQ